VFYQEKGIAWCKIAKAGLVRWEMLPKCGAWKIKDGRDLGLAI
jgi:hypothetical protein